MPKRDATEVINEFIARTADDPDLQNLSRDEVIALYRELCESLGVDPRVLFGTVYDNTAS